MFAQKKTKAEIKKWNDIWNKYSNEWSTLKTRAENIVAVFDGKKTKSRLPSIKNLSNDEEKSVLLRLLKDYIDDSDERLNSDQIIIKFRDEIIELCKYDRDTKDIFGFVNTWWVFSEVAKELNYKIFMAEVDDVGYKRTRRGENPMPNDLYRIDDNNEILVDDGVMETVLDYMRTIEWD